MKPTLLSRAFITALLACLALACSLTNRMVEPTPIPTSAPSPTPLPTSTPLPTDTPVPTPTFTPEAAPVEPTAAPPTNTPVVTAPIPATFAQNQVLRFGAGSFKQDIAGSVVSGSFDRYELNLAVGENLDIQLSSVQQTAGFTLLGPDRQPMRGSENAEARWWSSSLTTPGMYAIIVGSELGRADYTLSVTITPPGGASSGAYAALPASECKQVKNLAQGALPVAFSQSEAGFTVGAGVGGTACVLSANGTGADFENVAAVMSSLQSVFGEWSPDKTLSGDGPTGSVRGFRRGNDLMIISVQWRPAPEANCPAGQPIENCQLKPKQKLYAIVIQAARR